MSLTQFDITNVCVCVVGAVTVDRWFGSIDLWMAVLTFTMAVSGVVASYLRSIGWMYMVLLVQGVVETITHTGQYISG